MAFLHALFVALHVISAAAWFGLALRLASQARAVRDAEPAVAVALAHDGAYAVRLMGLFILLTFVFSMGALGLGGGYPGQWQYHVASLLIVVLVIVQYVLIRPTWLRLHDAATLESGSDGLVKRIAMLVGAGHAIWLVLALLMFWNRFAGVW